MNTGRTIWNDKGSGTRRKFAGQQMGSWLFGCRHKDMSRPFSRHGQTHRTCLECGARRNFDVSRWEMQGNFYYRLPETVVV